MCQHLQAGAADGQRLKSLRKPIKQLARALGVVRALDVSASLLTALADACDLAALTTPLVRHLRSQRRRHAKQLAQVVQRDDIVAALDRLKTACVDVDAVDWSSAIDRGAQTMEECLQRCGSREGSVKDDLHRLRIATKRLRYVLEIAGGDASSSRDSRIASLRQLQEVLGGLHDNEVARREVAAFLRDRGSLLTAAQTQAIRRLARAAAERERALRHDAMHFVRAMSDTIDV